jgi:hypothetical protein
LLLSYACIAVSSFYQHHLDRLHDVAAAGAVNRAYV